MTDLQIKNLTKALKEIETNYEINTKIEDSGCDLCGTIRLPLHKHEFYTMPSGRKMRVCEECKETM